MWAESPPGNVPIRQRSSVLNRDWTRNYRALLCVWYAFRDVLRRKEGEAMQDEAVNEDVTTTAPLPSASPTASVSPVAAIDDRIELMVAIPIAPKIGDVQGRRQVVRAGTLLARRVPGRPG